VVLQLLAVVHRNLNNTAKEVGTLKQFLQISDDSLDVYRRLLEIFTQQQDWAGVRDAARKILAVNPLQIQPYRSLATAGEQLKDSSTTARALECLLEFQTTDVALTHYRIAKIKVDQKRLRDAKRHALQALEEAPRYRDALRLLLKIKTMNRGLQNQK
ncbi:MAG: hypothetical protein VX438_09995, partial [Planctomycetota bacterium]|nr:hypothetical protein [Planctomycetota bacterium]